MSQEPDRMPLSVRIVVVCWAIVILPICWSALGCAQAGKWQGLAILLFIGGIACGHLVGLLRRRTTGWWLNRYTAKVLGTFAMFPLVFSVGYIIYALLGGNIPDGIGTPIALLGIIGLFLLLPAGLFWTIYLLLNTQKARRYCRVCPDCLQRIRAPIHVLFRRIECDLCRQDN